LYRQEKQDPARLFSCTDLSLDLLTKPLLEMPKVAAWKIEGRKKGPHYVFYTVKAYQILRDNPKDAKAKKMALDLLDQALGRPATHSTFLPQRPFMPIDPKGETSSGRMVAEIKRDQKKLYFEPREQLNPGDLIRIGYEDQPGHRTIPIRRRVPKRGRMDIPYSRHATGPSLPPGTKIFLVDRREPELKKLVNGLADELDFFPLPESKPSKFTVTWPNANTTRSKGRGKGKAKGRSAENITVYRNLPRGRVHGKGAYWLEHGTIVKVNRSAVSQSQWWLPPVIWPDEDKKYRSLIKEAVKKGAREFVINAPWQAAYFTDRKSSVLVAGPFCNAANRLALGVLKSLGCSSAIISPELPADEVAVLSQNSPIPLGIIVKGMWPFGIARSLSEEVRFDEPIKSPMHETMFVRQYGQNNWIYPAWELDLSNEHKTLERLGFKFYITMKEDWPRSVPRPKRTSIFNWRLDLL
jgi:putative protease